MSELYLSACTFWEKALQAMVNNQSSACTKLANPSLGADYHYQAPLWLVSAEFMQRLCNRVIHSKKSTNLTVMYLYFIYDVFIIMSISLFFPLQVGTNSSLAEQLSESLLWTFLSNAFSSAVRASETVVSVSQSDMTSWVEQTACRDNNWQPWFSVKPRKMCKHVWSVNLR